MHVSIAKVQRLRPHLADEHRAHDHTITGQVYINVHPWRFVDRLNVLHLLCWMCTRPGYVRLDLATCPVWNQKPPCRTKSATCHHIPSECHAAHSVTSTKIFSRWLGPFICNRQAVVIAVIRIIIDPQSTYPKEGKYLLQPRHTKYVVQNRRWQPPDVVTPTKTTRHRFCVRVSLRLE